MIIENKSGIFENKAERTCETKIIEMYNKIAN